MNKLTYNIFILGLSNKENNWTTGIALKLLINNILCNN
jgi:hypothetical protein